MLLPPELTPFRASVQVREISSPRARSSGWLPPARAPPACLLSRAPLLAVFEAHCEAHIAGTHSRRYVSTRAHNCDSAPVQAYVHARIKQFGVAFAQQLNTQLDEVQLLVGFRPLHQASSGCQLVRLRSNLLSLVVPLFLLVSQCGVLSLACK